jgi:hypothetical protein
MCISRARPYFHQEASEKNKNMRRGGGTNTTNATIDDDSNDASMQRLQIFITLLLLYMFGHKIFI